MTARTSPFVRSPFSRVNGLLSLLPAYTPTAATIATISNVTAIDRPIFRCALGRRDHISREGVAFGAPGGGGAGVQRPTFAPASARELHSKTSQLMACPAHLASSGGGHPSDVAPAKLWVLGQTRADRRVDLFATVAIAPRRYPGLPSTQIVTV
jgi:hypothetical protein